jgi:predicted site-specific integrase-resolvase
LGTRQEEEVNDGFHFTVTDLARFLGKSAVTIRGWERQGLISLPRDPNGDRRFAPDDVRVAAKRAHELGRINLKRLHLVEAAVTLLTTIEGEN